MFFDDYLVFLCICNQTQKQVTMKKLVKIFAMMLIGVAAMNMAACKGGEEVESNLEVNPQTLTFASDDAEAQTVTVTCTGAWTAETPDAEWITVTPESGTGNGEFTVSVAAGTAARTGYVAISSGKLSKTVTVKQTAPDAVPATGVELNETSKTMEIGEELQLIATVQPEGASQSVTWASSAGEIVSVDANGLVKALAAGPATITATTPEGLEAKCEITVQEEPIMLPADAGTISGPNSVRGGKTIDLEITEIERAETYVWYKNEEVCQETSSRTLTVTDGGEYKVAGKNISGEGKASAVHFVTLELLPAAAGPITMHDNGGFYSYTLTCEPIEGADFYRWYRKPDDGPKYVFMDNDDNHQILAAYIEPGAYTVVGVNEYGEGPESEPCIMAEHTAPDPEVGINQFAWNGEIFDIDPTAMDFWYHSILETNMFDGSKGETGTFNHMFKLIFPLHVLDGRPVDLATIGGLEYYASKAAWLSYPRSPEYFDYYGGEATITYDDTTLQLDFDVHFILLGDQGLFHFRAKFSGKAIKS
jgi:hypothetical protein